MANIFIFRNGKKEIQTKSGKPAGTGILKIKTSKENIIENGKNHTQMIILAVIAVIKNSYFSKKWLSEIPALDFFVKKEYNKVKKGRKN